MDTPITNTIKSDDLAHIPTARDPWSILQQAPGVLVDRINVGGNESGQQSNFIGGGNDPGDNTFAVDGIVITDMAALGSSPAYYDFDAFEEMQVTTGGADASFATAGVHINMVTRMGTNEWKGQARFESGFFDMGEKDPPENFTDLGLDSANFKSQWNGNLSVSGPVVKDKIYFFGQYSFNDINRDSEAGLPDNSFLGTGLAKFTADFNTKWGGRGFLSVFFQQRKQGREPLSIWSSLLPKLEG